MTSNKHIEFHKQFELLHFPFIPFITDSMNRVLTESRMSLLAREWYYLPLNVMNRFDETIPMFSIFLYNPVGFLCFPGGGGGGWGGVRAN